MKIYWIIACRACVIQGRYEYHASDIMAYNSSTVIDGSILMQMSQNSLNTKNLYRETCPKFTYRGNIAQLWIFHYKVLTLVGRLNSWQNYMCLYISKTISNYHNITTSIKWARSIYVLNFMTFVKFLMSSPKIIGFICLAICSKQIFYAR